MTQLQLQGFLRQGNLTSAADQLKAMMDKNPDNQQDRLTLALVRIQQRQYDEAETLLAEIRKSQPDSLAAASLIDRHADCPEQARGRRGDCQSIG